MRAERWRLLADPNAVLFVAISLLSGFGGAVMSLAAGVWVLDLTGSSSLAALAGFCFFLPTLLGPVLGTVVDHLPRRPLAVWTLLLTAALVLSLLAVRSSDHLWLIYAVMLGYGLSFILVDAAEAAILPAALPPTALGGVNGLRMSAQEGVKLVAPLVGAGLFTWRGGPPVALLAAALLVAAAGAYTLIKLRPRTGATADPADAPGRSETPDAASAPGSDDTDAPHDAAASGRLARFTARTRAGVAYLWRRPALRLTVLIGSATIAMSGLNQAAVYAVVTGALHRPPAFVGVLTSAQGAGSIVGGLIIGRLLTRWGPLAVGAVGALLFATGAAALTVPYWPVVLGGMMVIGLGLPWTLVAAMTAVQLDTPDRLLGRVSGTASTLLFTPITVFNPIGAAGVLLDRRVPSLVAAAVCLGCGLFGLYRRRLGANLTGRADEPAGTVRTTDAETAAAAGAETDDVPITERATTAAAP